MKTKKSTIFRIFAALLSLCCIFSSLVYSAPKASADEILEDLQEQYDDIEDKISQNQSELGEIQSDISDAESTLASINAEIDDVNSQIDILETRITTLNTDIAAKEKEIADTEKAIDSLTTKIEEAQQQREETEAEMEETKTQLLGRMRENYMSGESSTLEILFSSDDISSYFARKELMQRVSEKDAKLVQGLVDDINYLNILEEQLASDKADLETKKTGLETEKAELETRKTDLQDSMTTLQTKKAEVTKKQEAAQTLLTELDQNSEAYKNAISRQVREKEKISTQIDTYIKQHGSSVGDTPDASYDNDGQMAWPVKFHSYVTAGYPAYSNGNAHWGIDICAVGGNTRGRDFNAAQGGKVIIATNDGNWNYGFGNYCVIDHGDGTQTLYAHSDNILVYVGQVVKKGQRIGIIGATGNVTGPHLHFEVRVKQADGSVSRVQPLNYVTNNT